MSRNEVPEISVQEANRQVGDGATLFMDVRDPRSFESAHIPGAVRVDDSNIGDVLRSTDRNRPVVVYCYHGHSSLGGAAYLLGQGFRHVASLHGGFEAWRQARLPASRGAASAPSASQVRSMQM